MTAHDTTSAVDLDVELLAIAGEKLTRAEQLDHLVALTEGGDPDLAALLDHLCIQTTRLVEFVDALGPALEGFADMGEQLMGGGMMGMIMSMMGGAGQYDPGAGGPFDPDQG